MPHADLIPETIDEITPIWLNTVLKTDARFDETEIDSFTRDQLGDGEGFLGDIFRLNLSYSKANEAAPQSLVVKIPKRANRSIGELLGAYERESMFFETLSNDIPARIPQLYYGAFDRDRGSEKQQEILAFADGLPKFLSNAFAGFGKWIAARKNRRYILLLEDIDQARGGDQVAGANADLCKKVLGEIAKTHAAFWRKEGLENHFWLLPQNIDRRMRHQMFLGAREPFAAGFGDLLSEGMDEYIAWLEPRGVALMEKLTNSAPETLIHCDLRLDNIMFAGDEADPNVVVIDWQLVRRGSAAYDVAYFLSGAIKSDTDKDTIDDLLAHYHQSLVDAGVSGYSRENLELDYQRALLLVLQTLTTIDQVDMGDGRGLELQKTWMRRLLARLRHVDLKRVL